MWSVHASFHTQKISEDSLLEQDILGFEVAVYYSGFVEQRETIQQLLRKDSDKFSE